MERLDVTISGRIYSLACKPEEKPALVAAVKYLDDKMRLLRSGGKAGGNDRLAVMAALQIATELITFKQSTGPFSGASVGELQQKIDDMNRCVEEALVYQPKLF